MFHLRNLTFKIYKKLKSNYDLLVLVLFPIPEITQFWSVNYMCRVCKLYFLFWKFPFGQRLYLNVFSKQRVLLVALLVEYALSQINSHCIRNCIFLDTF